MATSYEVAAYANVSATTVSNASNRPEQMKPETRPRVLDATRLPGYRPNLNAQALARGRPSMVGLFVSDSCLPYTANATRWVEDKLTSAAPRGHLVLETLKGRP